jgi:putative ABC transport system permease protein
MLGGNSQVEKPDDRPHLVECGALPRLASLQKLAWRELNSSKGRALPVFLIVALSIGAYTAIRGTSQVFVRALRDQARAGLAADLSIEMYEEPTSAQLEALERLRAAGAKWTEVTSTVFLAASTRSGEPVAAVIKGVDPLLYPFYGEMQLDPPQQLGAALASFAVVVSEDLARRLAIGPGDEISVNGVARRVSATIRYEPDRFAGNFSSSLRVLMSGAAMEESGILDAGIPALHRILVWLPVEMDLAARQLELSDQFPGVEIFGVREINPVGADAVQTASQALSMLAWLAVAIGAASVAMIARLHIEWRLDTVATLKCLGARPRVAGLWLGLQLVMLGGAGGVAGSLLGLAARRPLLWSARVSPQLAETGPAALTGGAIAASMALGAALGVALSVSMVLIWAVSASQCRPAVLLRRNTAEPRAPETPWMMPWKWGIAGGSVCGMLAAAVFGVKQQGVFLVAALGIGLTLFYQLTRVLLWVVSRLLPAQLGARSPAMRHGIKRLVRPGLSAATVVAAVALIAMLLTAVAVGQSIVAGEILRSLPLGEANLYLMGFAHSQLGDVHYVLDRNSGIAQPYGIFNLTWRRVSKRPPAATGRLQPMRMVSCRDDLAKGSGVIVGKDLARRLGVTPGSDLYLERDGKTLRTTVAGVRDVPPAERTWYSITLPCADADPNTLFHGAGLVVKDSEFENVWQDLQESFPAMGIATPDAAFEEISKVLRISVGLIRFLAVATALSGLVIVAGLIAATARQRAREIAIYRVLGASRNTVARVVSAEFATLGLTAGLIGGAAGIVLTNVSLSVALQRTVLDPHLSTLMIAILCGLGVASIAGWLAARRFLAERPLVILRRE